MNEAARLTRGGRAITPEELLCRVVPLEPGAARAYREAAFAAARVYERDGLSIYGFGAGAHLEFAGGLSKEAPRAATALLRAVEVVGDHRVSGLGAGPIALGALAFAPEAASSLCLPATSIVVSGDRAAALLVGARETLGEAAPSAGELAPGLTGESPDAFELVSARPHAEFRELVSLALEAIEHGNLDKVVLAREVTITANRPFIQAELVERLRALYPSCATFALEGFIGASPELLCALREGEVVAHPLAGTIARSGDPEDDARRETAFLANPKERAEHAVVVEFIAATLRRVTSDLEVPETPSLLELRNVSHLGTHITGALRPGALESVLELVAQLHPTPAVGGAPREPALEFLRRHEGLARDRYAGPVGFVTASGEGEFYLGIRSAIVEENRARLLAGVGIVKGSEPAAELAETQLKLQALLAAAVRP